MACAGRRLQTQLLDTAKRQIRSPRNCQLCLRSPRSRFANVQHTVAQHRTFAAQGARQQDDSTAARKTYYDLFPETFAEGPPPDAPFSPDLKALRKEFLKLQAKAHPDLVGPDQKRQAEAMSATINEAYRTLQDPLARARYLLSLRNVDLEDDSMKLSENELLMEVMEAREAVDEAEDEEDLHGLKQENQQRIDKEIGALEDSFASGDLETAAQHAIRLRYWKNIEESILGWEQGTGGGVNHH